MDDLSDSELLRRWLTGDRDAMGQFCRRHLDTAWRYALALSRSSAEADDVTQASFERICQCAAQFHGENSARSWVLTIVGNTWRNKRRAAIRRQYHQSTYAAEAHMHAPMLPDRTQEATEQAALVHATVAELPDRYQHPLRLHYFEGLSTAEVAQALGRSRKTVESQLLRGRGLLREALLRRGVTASLLAVPGLLAAAGPGPSAPLELASSLQTTIAQTAIPTGLSASGVTTLLTKGPTTLLTSAVLLTFTLPFIIPNPQVQADPSSLASFSEDMQPRMDPKPQRPQTPPSWLTQEIDTRLIRATVRESIEALRAALQRQGVHIRYAVPWEQPWHLSTARYQEGGPFVTHTAGSLSARAFLDSLASQTGLHWHTQHGTLYLHEPLAPEAAQLREQRDDQRQNNYQRHAAAARLAQAGDRASLTWLINKAVQPGTPADDPSYRWVENRLKDHRLADHGIATYLSWAQVDQQLLTKLAGRWQADDPLLAGLGAALGVDSQNIRSGLVRALATKAQSVPKTGSDYQRTWGQFRHHVFLSHVSYLLQQDPAGAAPLAQLLNKHANTFAPEVRSQVALLFGRLRWQAATGTLESWLKDQTCRAAAAQGLLLMNFNEHFDKVVAALSGQERIDTLAHFDRPQSSRMLLANLQSTVDSKRDLLAALLSQHNHVATAWMQAQLHGNTNDMTRRLVVGELAQRGDAKALQLVRSGRITYPRGLRHASPDAHKSDNAALNGQEQLAKRRQALLRIGLARTQAGTDAVLRSVDDPDMTVPALHLLKPYAGTRADVRARLLTMLADPGRQGFDLIAVINALVWLIDDPIVCKAIAAKLDITDSKLCIGLVSNNGEVLWRLLRVNDAATRKQVANMIIDLTSHEHPQVQRNAQALLVRLQTQEGYDLEGLTGRKATVTKDPNRKGRRKPSPRPDGQTEF